MSGTDASDFNLADTANDGTYELRVRRLCPNFEMRSGSSDGDNVYEVTVKAASDRHRGWCDGKSTTVDVMVDRDQR